MTGRRDVLGRGALAGVALSVMTTCVMPPVRPAMAEKGSEVAAPAAPQAATPPAPVTAAGPFAGQVRFAGSGLNGTAALSAQGRYQRAAVDARQQPQRREAQGACPRTCRIGAVGAIQRHRGCVFTPALGRGLGLTAYGLLLSGVILGTLSWGLPFWG